MIDNQQIKEYNKKLEEYKRSYEKLEAEREFALAEIERLCSELTSELGTEVTLENVSEFYKEYEQKVINTLTAGEEIFNRIKSEAEYDMELV